MKKLILCLVLLPVLAWADDEKELGLANESALGYVVTGGNSESETTSIKQQTTYTWNWDILKLTGHYLQSSGLVDVPTAANPNRQESKVTAENWAANLRFEKVLTPKWFNAFVAHGWYGDRFQGVQEGHSSDIGGKYYTANTKTFQQYFELGYRYTQEFLVNSSTTKVGVGDSHHPEYHYARLFGKVDYNYNKSMSLGLWLEYLPSITKFSEDQRINYSPYVTSVLTDVFSLQVAYESRYRFKPAVDGNKLTDYTFTTSLLAKF